MTRQESQDAILNAIAEYDRGGAKAGAKFTHYEIAIAAQRPVAIVGGVLAYYARQGLIQCEMDPVTGIRQYFFPDVASSLLPAAPVVPRRRTPERLPSAFVSEIGHFDGSGPTAARVALNEAAIRACHLKRADRADVFADEHRLVLAIGPDRRHKGRRRHHQWDIRSRLLLRQLRQCGWQLPMHIPLAYDENSRTFIGERAAKTETENVAT